MFRKVLVVLLLCTAVLPAAAASAQEANRGGDPSISAAGRRDGIRLYQRLLDVKKRLGKKAAQREFRAMSKVQQRYAAWAGSIDRIECKPGRIERVRMRSAITTQGTIDCDDVTAQFVAWTHIPNVSGSRTLNLPYSAAIAPPTISLATKKPGHRSVGPARSTTTLPTTSSRRRGARTGLEVSEAPIGMSGPRGSSTISVAKYG